VQWIYYTPPDNEVYSGILVSKCHLSVDTIFSIAELSCLKTQCLHIVYASVKMLFKVAGKLE
jgi:hypothetical protein